MKTITGLAWLSRMSRRLIASAVRCRRAEGSCVDGLTASAGTSSKDRRAGAMGSSASSKLSSWPVTFSRIAAGSSDVAI